MTDKNKKFEEIRMGNEKMTDDIKDSIDKMDLTAATGILKYEKDESYVVDIGCNYCDKFIETLHGTIKILTETPTKNDISYVIKGF